MFKRRWGDRSPLVRLAHRFRAKSPDSAGAIFKLDHHCMVGRRFDRQMRNDRTGRWPFRYAGRMKKRREGAPMWQVDPGSIKWDELYATTRPPEVLNPAFRETLMQAIAAKRVIRFATRDDPRPRRAEPHVFGRSADRDRVLLHPDRSDRNPLTSLGIDWRVIALEDFTSLELLDQRFPKRTLPRSLDPDAQTPPER
jgi:hypothetical protein